jgi:NAD(P)-dependent dehydrogenase (short-subunit alcohol dehydrogenase family)
VVATPGDVTRLQDNQRAVEQTVRAFGQLDIFVGNAGIFARYLSLADVPEEKLGDVFDEQFGINVKGCLLGAKAALPELLKTEGCLIFTASVVWRPWTKASSPTGLHRISIGRKGYAPALPELGPHQYGKPA